MKVYFKNPKSSLLTSQSCTCKISYHLYISMWFKKEKKSRIHFYFFLFLIEQVESKVGRKISNKIRFHVSTHTWHPFTNFSFCFDIWFVTLSIDFGKRWSIDLCYQLGEGEGRVWLEAAVENRLQIAFNARINV